MRYIKCTYYNGQMPKIDGLKFVFALESEYPTEKPKFFCTIPDDAKTDFVAGVISELTEAEYNVARENEYAARLEKAKHERIAALAEHRYYAENKDLTLFNGMVIGTSKDERTNFDWVIKNVENNDSKGRYGGKPVMVVFKFKNGTRKLSVGDLKIIEQAIFRHVQRCFELEFEIAQKIWACNTLEAVNKIDIMALWDAK